MLAIESIEKSYDGFHLGPLDLALDDDVLAVLGPSGSGKSTLLSLVAGLADPDGGSVALDGRTLDGRPPERRGVGLVFQDGALFPHMTARENVAYAGVPPGRVTDVAERLEITDVLDRPASALSGGERQRVALARALAADPDALLLDEPLANLDAPIRRRLRVELSALFESLSVPVVYVTHDQRAATAVADRIAVLRDGQVEQVGPTRAVLQRPATPFVAAFTGSETLFDATVRDGDGATRLELGGTTLAVRTDAGDETRVTCSVRPERVRVHSPDDDVDVPNVLDGTVRRATYQGEDYRLLVDVTGADDPFVVRAPTARAERLSLADGTAVRLSLPPEAVHVMDEVS